MFGIGWSEFVLIALVLLIFVGPRHLPAVLKKAGMVIGELKLQHQVSEEVRDIERSIGDIKSPDALLRDLTDDISEGLKDPYEEIRRSEAAFQAELHTIKTEIKTAAPSADSMVASADADTGSSTSVDSNSAAEKPDGGEPT